MPNEIIASTLSLRNVDLHVAVWAEWRFERNYWILYLRPGKDKPAEPIMAESGLELKNIGRIAELLYVVFVEACRKEREALDKGSKAPQISSNQIV